MTISELFSSVFLAVRYRMAQPRAAEPTSPHGGALFKKLLAVALPVSASALAGNLISSANTVLIPQRLMASGMAQGEAVGALGVLLGMAAPLFMLPMAFVGPLVMVMLPRLSEDCALNNKADLHRRMGKALYATGLIALPAVAVMAPIGTAACELLYGQALSQEYFLILAASLVFVYYHVVTSGMLNGTGLQNRAMASSIIGGAVQLAFTWFLVADRRFGIYGFMLGMFANSLLSTALNVYWLSAKTGFRIRWAQWVVLPSLAAAACGLASGNVQMLMGKLGWTGIPSMLWPITAGIMVYILSLKIQGIKIGKYIGTLLPQGKARAAAVNVNSFYF